RGAPHAPCPSGPRLQGSGDHQRRLRLHARPPGRLGDPRRRRRARQLSQRRDRPTGLGRPGERLRPRAPGRGAGAPGGGGGSIEAFDRHDGALYELERATERIAAAVEAARGLEFPFTLTARAENFLRGNPDLDDTVARLRAFEEAGADVLYAPALTTAEQIRTVCEAVTKPVNVLAFARLGLRF